MCANSSNVHTIVDYLFCSLLFSRDPMDSFLLEQHLRTPLRLFPDPFSPQMLQQDPEAQAALIEKARQHLQMWGRTAYPELLLPQMYQRSNLGGLHISLWQAASQWPPAGFLAANAAAAAQSQNAARTPPPAVSTPSSSGSPSPDMRTKHFQRFSPYQIPQHHNTSSSSSSRGSPPNTNNNNSSTNNNNNSN